MTLRCAVVVNRRRHVGATQSTTALVHGAVARGWKVVVGSIDDLSLRADDHVVLDAVAVPPERSRRALVGALARGTATPVDLDDIDVVLIRTNPASGEPAGRIHEAGLHLLAMAVDRGVLVLNDPVGLLRASSKLFLGALPRPQRPRTLVSRNADTLRDFVREAPGKVVLKPLQGTKGRDVFFLDPTDNANLAQICDVLVRDGFAMAQDFVPEAHDGDIRLILVDGRPLEVADKVCAVRRVPASGELRSNVAQGGTPGPVDDPRKALKVGRAVGARLRKDGLFLTGLDVIGDRCVEINVFSPGGLDDAGAFHDVDFVPPILEAIEARIATHEEHPRTIRRRARRDEDGGDTT